MWRGVGVLPVGPVRNEVKGAGKGGGWKACEWADKPGSVEGRSFISNACRHAPQARNPNAGKGGFIAFLFAFAPDGVCQATPLPTRWCALTAPFQLFSWFGGTQAVSAGESSFLWHFPSGHPAQLLAGILPFGARTFLTPKRAIAWPTRACYSSVPAHRTQRAPQEKVRCSMRLARRCGLASEAGVQWNGELVRSY